MKASPLRATLQAFLAWDSTVKILLVAVSATVLFTSQVRAADPELSTDTKRMLAYGTLAVMTGACKTTLTADQRTKMNTGLQQAAEAQKELTEAQFTDMMKSVGAQVGQNKDQVCAALTPEFVNTSLEEAAAGE